MNEIHSSLSFLVAEGLFTVNFFDEEPDGGRSLLPSYAPFYVKPEDLTPSLERFFTINVGGALVPFEASEAHEEVGDFDCGGIMHHVYRTPEGGYLMLISNLSNQPACALLSNADFSQCQASLFGDVANRRFGLGNALMIAYAFAGCHHHTLLIHASVPMQGGRAYCFLGKSGTGKSTHSRLWLKHIEGTELLNDDNPAVRVNPTTGEVRIYGTPWSGKTPCYRNLSLPAGGFLRLQQYPENIIRRERPIQAFASILASCSSMIWDVTSYNEITRIVERVAQTVPTCHLQCLPDEAAARLSFSTFTSIAAQ